MLLLSEDQRLASGTDTSNRKIKHYFVKGKSVKLRWKRRQLVCATNRALLHGDNKMKVKRSVASLGQRRRTRGGSRVQQLLYRTGATV